MNNGGGPQPVAPTADFTAMPNPAQVNQTVNFDGSASHDNDDVGCTRASDSRKCIVSYFWTFGDGATQTTTGPTTSHAYSTAGTYRASLTVTDNDGQTASTDQFVQVNAPPRPSEQKVSGGGAIPVGSGSGKFGFEVKKRFNGGPSGQLNYEDRGGSVKVMSESITSLTISGNGARFTGQCSINKVSGFTFTVDVIDNGEPGSSDFFHIHLNNGYDASGTLSRGNIQIHP